MEPKRKNRIFFKIFWKFLGNEMFTNEDFFTGFKNLLLKVLSFLQEKQQSRYGDEGAGDEKVVPAQVFG